MSVACTKLQVKILQWQPEPANGRTDNATAKIKKTKGQTRIYKTLHRIPMIEHSNSTTTELIYFGQDLSPLK
jgi:hypothetical protein